MRTNTLDVLIVSNLWPPYFVGGYELGARDVADGLARRGHRIQVLTSSFGVTPSHDGTVHRLMYEQVHYRALRHRELVRETWASARALPRVREFLRGACFDVVHLFNPLGLTAGLVQEICDTGRPVVAYVSDNWAAQWPYCDRLLAHWMQPRPQFDAPRKAAFLAMRQLARRAGVLPRRPDWLPVRHAQFVSRYIRDISLSRMAPTTQEVIPWGIHVDRFPFRERRPDELSKWIFVGQVVEHKGVHTTVEAVRLLRDRGTPVTLAIYGDDRLPWAQALKAKVAADGLDDRVRFHGELPRDRLWAEAYDAGGLLVFPTMWEEPFSITVLEAFASGIPVIATLTGGTGELVRHGETATVFGVGNAEQLAVQFLTLVRHPERAAAMARRAREIVAQHLDIDRMVDRVERHLVEVVEGRGSSGAVEYFVPAPHPWESAATHAGFATRALEPEQGWLGGLLQEVGLDTTRREALAELDSAPDRLFPIAYPQSAILQPPYAELIRGLVLNAGAGTVPLALGERQVRIDLQMHTCPDACADLHALPFRDGTFDSAVSIAVLEHCRRPWVVLRELARVVRRGGHVLLSAPFLEPRHANPGDYFRFTDDGLRELASDAQLTVVATGADYAVQHAVGWILWELVRHHPRHRYLASDRRVHAWFDSFTRAPGRVQIPTLVDGYYLVARRD